MTNRNERMPRAERMPRSGRMPRAERMPPGLDHLVVTRGTRLNAVAGWIGLGIVAVLAVLPFVVFQDVTDGLIRFFILLIMATMWNLLAGFGGLVSVGQQAYIGIGGYTVVAFVSVGMSPYLAIVLGVIVAAVLALPTSWIAFRLRGDYFAVGTWVIAEVYRLLVVRVDALGGPSGTSLPSLGGVDPALRGALTYWAALAFAVVAVAAVYLLLRSRVGLALTAVRDDDVSASASGVKVSRAKRITYLVSAAGCGAAGGILVVNALGVQPSAIFSVQWSAYMIFIVIIGGIGYIEGPIVGTIIFFGLQSLLADFGPVYLIVLGLVAIAGAIWLPRGVWGFISDRTGLSLFPVGYRVQYPVPDASGRAGGAGSAGSAGAPITDAAGPPRPGGPA